MEPLTDKLSYTQREALEQRVPALRSLRIDYIELCEACARAVLFGKDIEAVEKRRKSFLKTMVKRQRELLLSYGIDPKELSPDYECTLCRDTGIVLDGGIKRPCQCRIAKLQRQRDAKFTTFSRFSDFDAAIYADDEQKIKALDLKARLENYIALFPDNEKPNLLLRGNTGLGKTFFLRCLTSGIHERGIRAEMLPAYELFDSFRKQHLGEEYVLPKLSHLPFLAIDDLGVEPIYRNITVEYFNELLDLRLIRSLPTAITTNLDAPSLRERYGERIVSRLYDHKQFYIMILQGQSLRRKQKQTADNVTQSLEIF